MSMKKNKKINILTALVLFFVLLIPVVPEAAEGDKFKFTSLECVLENNFTTDSWQDCELIFNYNVKNGQYSEYNDKWNELPVSPGDYDYYILYRDRENYHFFGLHTEFVYMLSNANLMGLSDITKYPAQVLDYKNDILDDNFVYGQLRFYFDSAICDYYTYVFTSDGWQWKNEYSNKEFLYEMSDKEYQSVNGAIVDTNMDLYSCYDMTLSGVDGVLVTGSDGISFANQLPTHSQVYEAIPSMTVLNRNLKYYDGTDIIDRDPKLLPDNTLGFNYINLRRCYNENQPGCRSAICEYDLTSDTVKRVDSSYKIVYEITLDYELCVSYGSKYVDDTIERGSVSGTVEEQLSNLDKTNYRTEFNIVELIENKYNGNPFNFSSNLKFYRFVRAVGNTQDDLGNFYDIAIDSVSKYMSFSAPVYGGVLGEILGDTLSEADTSSYGFNYLSMHVDAYLTDGTTRSQSAIANLDFLSGANDGNVSDVDENDNKTPVEGSEHSDNNEYQVEPEPDGFGGTNYNYYYYDYSNHTVTPAGGSGTTNNKIVLEFANALQLLGIPANNSSSSSAGGGSSGDNIVIEDDDYTDTSLREDLKDGFGLFDDLSTSAKGDGFIKMITDVYSGLPGDLGNTILFGVASVAAIGIIRAITKR